jgi:hypothetical protein
MGLQVSCYSHSSALFILSVIAKIVSDFMEPAGSSLCSQKLIAVNVYHESLTASVRNGNLEVPVYFLAAKHEYAVRKTKRR